MTYVKKGRFSPLAGNGLDQSQSGRIGKLTKADIAETQQLTRDDLIVTPEGLSNVVYGFNHNFKSGFTMTQDDGTVASGVSGEVNIMSFSRGALQIYNVGTQDIIAPVISASGLNIARDNTAGDGAQIYEELATGWGSVQYTIGTSNQFVVTMTINIQDASGANPFVVGFVKTPQTLNQDYTLYTDYALYGVVGTAAKLQTITNLNSGGAVTTDTTQTFIDGATNTFQVIVNKNGAVSYRLNGASPTVTAAFTFDSGDVVTPFIAFAQAADITTGANIQAFSTRYALIREFE